MSNNENPEEMPYGEVGNQNIRHKFTPEEKEEVRKFILQLQPSPESAILLDENNLCQYFPHLASRRPALEYFLPSTESETQQISRQLLELTRRYNANPSLLTKASLW